MRISGKILIGVIAAVMLCAADVACYGQSSGGRRRIQTPPSPLRQDVRKFQIVGGILHEVGGQVILDSLANRSPEAARQMSDSLIRKAERMRVDARLAASRADSLTVADPNTAAQSDSLRLSASRIFAQADSLDREAEKFLEIHNIITADSLKTQTLSRREQRRADRLALEADTSFVRYSRLFRDTLPLSRMTAISLVLPGFSQLHNKQAWKIPILYATAGTSLYFAAIQNNYYHQIRRQYEARIRYGYDRQTSDLDAVQASMIKYNTRRQLLFGAALVSYLYFVGDGVVNYPGQTSHIKKATTLSTIIPGAGQIYNKSYWKVPIVVGSFATMAYIVDWNNRGYVRFRRAYDIVTDGNPNTHSEFWDGTRELLTAENLANYRNAYRRNRDLSIILTGAVYLIQLVDAHVDAHMKSFDISNDLSFDVRPSMTNLYTCRTGSLNMVGLSLNIRF